jgi:serine/threonine protein phosphatase PrpC
MTHSERRLLVAAKTDTGRVRDHNEDAYLVVDLDTAKCSESTVEFSVGDRGVLLAVSDGMGGAAAGEVASAVSCDALLTELSRDEEGSIPDRLRRTVHRASKRVRDESKRPGRSGMGATLTAVLLSDSSAHIAQIGDSRAYLLRGGAIVQVTHDQSYVQMLIDEGVMTPEQAEHSPQKSVLLQAMGQSGELRVDLGKLAVRPGDRLLLCSDGLTNAITDQQILKLAMRDEPEAACTALIDAANDAGGPDNITVVLAVVE